MRIGGMQKNSFIDYPGKVSGVLFAAGCNFDCPYCHNPQLVRGDGSGGAGIGESDIFDFLAARRGFLDGVVLSGGEPTLQPDLVAFCERIHEMGYPIKLDTNGSRPEMIRELIERGSVDYVAMDLKTDPEGYVPLIQKKMETESIIESVHLIMDSGIDYEFKTTCVKPLVDEKVVENIGRLIRNARLYVLQQCYSAKVLHPEFFETENRLFTDTDLNRLQSAAAPWVRECILR
jgi:pyruvate formate lyase activating enzyme